MALPQQLALALQIRQIWATILGYSALLSVCQDLCWDLFVWVFCLSVLRLRSHVVDQTGLDLTL